MSSYPHLRVERPSDGVALVTLDNPEMRNAMSDEMTASWVAVVAELAPLAPNTPIRRAGADRYETAVQVAGAFSSAPVVYLARGDQFPDALAAGAAAAVRRGPILLTRPDCIPFDVDLAIQRLNPEQVIVLGGTSALSDAVLARTRC